MTAAPKFTPGLCRYPLCCDQGRDDPPLYRYEEGNDMVDGYRMVLDVPGYVRAPWNTGDNCRDGDAVGVFRSDCSLICSVHIDGDYGDDGESKRALFTARLIAAAPELYEALAAICAKDHCYVGDDADTGSTTSLYTLIKSARAALAKVGAP